MSNVTTYIIFTNYDELGTLMVIEKLLELSGNYKSYEEIETVAEQIYDKAEAYLEMNVFGDKMPEFDRILFFGFNYFPHDKFEEWYYDKYFDGVQVMVKREHDDKFELL